MKWSLITVVTAIIATPLDASAPSAEEMAGKLGAREFLRSISLAPSGDKVVIVSPRDAGGETALVIDIKAGTFTPVLSAKGGEEQIGNCQFVLEDRVVCRILLRESSNRSVVTANRLVSIPADGSEMQLLTAKAPAEAYFESGYGGGIIDYNVPDEPNSVLMLRYFSPEFKTGNMTGRMSDGLGVEKVDLKTMKRKLVEQPKRSAVGYLSDGKGNIRVMVTQRTSSNGYGELSYTYSYKLDGGSWRELSSVDIESGLSYGFEPIAVDSDKDIVFGIEDYNGFAALFSAPLDGSGEKSLLLARDGADVDRLLRIGRQRRIVGASYATEKRMVEYFDPELKQLVLQLHSALGEGMQISIADASSDETKLLIFAGSDTKPGEFYIFDKSTKRLGQLLPLRPELKGMKFGEMRPVSFKASDGTEIPGYLTLPPGSGGRNLPAIVMPHGGPWSRDEWGFDWFVQYFAARGFAVLQPNFRGSSGYGSAWFQKNGFQSWKTAIGDINDAGRWLEKEGIAAPGKLAIVGWSYGGYAALQSAVVDPELFKAIVAIAPVTDLDALREESRYDYDFRFIDNAIGHGDHIDAGSPARHADRFQAPVLLVHGDADTNVRVSESRLMDRRLEKAGKEVKYIEFDGLSHSLDDPAARAKLLLESEATIRRGLGL